MLSSKPVQNPPVLEKAIAVDDIDTRINRRGCY